MLRCSRPCPGDCPDSTSKEEEDEMALNWGNKSLETLWLQGTRGQLHKKSLSPKFLLFFPLLPLYPLLTLDCTPFQIRRRRGQCNSLRKGRWPLRRAQNNRKQLKTPKTKGPLLWTAGRSKIWPRCAFNNLPGLLS